MKVKLDDDGEIKTPPGLDKLKLSVFKFDTTKKKTGGKKSRIRIATSTVRYKAKIQSRQSK